MKKSMKIACALLSALASCDIAEYPHDPRGCETAEISLVARMPATMVAETRAGTAAENAITDIHVLLFDTTNGELVHKEKGKDLTPDAENGGSIVFRAALPVGVEYDAMVLTNVESDLAHIAPDAAPATTKADVEALVRRLAPATKWDPASLPIPMWDERTVVFTADGAPVFHLTRMLARVGVEYSPGAADRPFLLTEVRFYNYNTAGCIVPDAANMSGSGGERKATAPTIPSDPATQIADALIYNGDDIVEGRECRHRIYVFEAAHRGAWPATEEGADNPCLVVGGKYDSGGDGDPTDEPTGWYRIDFVRKGVWSSIMRNYSYDVLITSVGGAGYPDPETALRSAPINIVAEVLPWNEGVRPEPAGSVSVSPGERMFPATISPANTYRLTVTSLDPDGNEDTETTWTLASVDPSWCRLSDDPATLFDDAAEVFESRGSQVLYLIVTSNANSDPRATIITIDGRPGSKVVQRGRRHDMAVGGDNISAGSGARFFTYVGAFWRAGQTGERIIRIRAGADPANAGRWVANVVWMDHLWGPDDGVVLSAVTLPELQSANPAIYTLSPGDAEDYPLDGITDTHAEGLVTTDSEEGRHITFRVGLKTPYTPTVQHPARYAVIQLSFGGSKAQRIFLRQGEGADYLMGPGDPVHSGELADHVRTAVRQFAPYNLTAATLNAKISNDNPSMFTDYPSKAGALFQWASFYSAQQKVAWDPWSAWPQGVMWRQDGTAGYWPGQTETANETCPAGYRRPTDGPVDRNWPNTDISDSEVRQSLWYEPMTGQLVYNRTNSFWGYYADGWFDRRPLEKMLTGDTSPTIASKGTPDAAYAGHLFYNPFFDSDHYNASLFFPAAGYRDLTFGQLTAAARTGFYWTSSTEVGSSLNGPYSWSYILNYEGRAANVNAHRSNAGSIRCVKR